MKRKSPPRLCPAKTLRALRRAAEFDADFAGLERSLSFAKAIRGTVLTPEQMTTELHLTPERVGRIRSETHVDFRWFVPVFDALTRHHLMPPSAQTWDVWLLAYCRTKRRHRRVRMEFRKAFLSGRRVLSLPSVARLLRVNAATVIQRYCEGRICGVRVGKSSFVFPRWQFDPKTRRVRGFILQALVQLKRTSDSDDWVTCAFLLTQQSILDGLAPVSVDNTRLDPSLIARAIRDSNLYC